MRTIHVGDRGRMIWPVSRAISPSKKKADTCDTRGIVSEARLDAQYTWDMEIDLDIVGYTIKTAEKGQCSGIYLSHDLGQAKMGKCPTNPIYAIYKDGSKDADYRCWKHFREFRSE